MKKMDFSIALVGNPNCGKTTLFNALTGASQHVGNWPGVTVERKSGYLNVTDKKIEVIDLPGIYSLTCSDSDAAVDERIACDFILQQKTNVFINIVDASHLERHLYLTLQLLEMGVPVILALNMMDVARARQIQIDMTGLARELGCPVIALEAHKGNGVRDLKHALMNAEQHTSKTLPYLNEIQTIPQEDADIFMADMRYQFIQKICQQYVKLAAKPITTWTSRIDRIVLHRLFGVPVFLAVMYLLFLFSMDIGGIFQTFFDKTSEFIFVDGVSSLLTTLGAPAWLIAILAHGVGKGINTIVTFIPVIGALFLFLALLEDSGYMARAAFVVDRLMRVIGLPGKAFVPMIVGFGCNVPAVMAARTLENKRDRIISILMSPFMSCGARLAIYAVFTAAFFPHNGQHIVFALYLIGILMAVLTGLMLRRTLLAGDPAPLVMELPSYHVPRMQTLLFHSWQRLRDFIFRAGKLILPVCIVIGALNTGIGDSQSLLSKMGEWLTPWFAPMGIAASNWPATVGLITGVLAKEVVVGTLNTLYGELALYQQFDGQIGAFAYLLFVLLYFPCVSTMAAMVRELHRGWAIFSACWNTGVAYAVAVVFYQAATWSRHPLSSSLWIVSLSILFMSVIVMIRSLASRQALEVMQPVAGCVQKPACGSRCFSCPLSAIEKYV
jgi:ferrous iron transport protein B